MSAVDFFAYEDVTVGTTAVALTAATYSRGNYARIQVDGDWIRYNFPTPPTATSGLLAAPFQTSLGYLELESADEIAKFQAISKTGAPTVLRVLYGRRN